MRTTRDETEGQKRVIKLRSGEARVKGFLRRVLPERSMESLIHTAILLDAAIHYPVNRATGARASKNGSHSAAKARELEQSSRRIFSYNHALLPNFFLAELESGVADLDSATRNTGLTIGYPAWNLLYFVLLCSLPTKTRPLVVVETGTNRGISTIILAQALKDAGVAAAVHTVDIDSEIVKIARENVARAGLAEYIQFHVEDSHNFLRSFVRENREIDFAFLDGNHSYHHLREEFAIIYSSVVAARGSVYFDNTAAGGVFRALRYIKRAYLGNLVEFQNCSWGPPGNAVWQPR